MRIGFDKKKLMNDKIGKRKKIYKKLIPNKINCNKKEQRNFFERLKK